MMVPAVLFAAALFALCGCGAANMHGSLIGFERPPQQHPYELPEDASNRIGRSKGAFYVWNNEKKFFGCFMPKVGCSNWLHYLRYMLLPASNYEGSMKKIFNPKSYDNFGLHFRKGSMADLRVFERVMNNDKYFKWAVVRHPWKRLVSGFRSKYEGECNFKRQCIREVYKVPVPDSPNPLEFSEFVEALSLQSAKDMDKHFRPQYLLCELDRIPYNFIGDLGVQEHMDYISMKSNLPETFTAVENEAAAQVFGDSYYMGRTHAVHNCTARTVELVQRIYHMDAMLLGYSFDDALRSCSQFGMTSFPLVETTPVKDQRQP